MQPDTRRIFAGHRVRDLRSRLGLSQAVMARRLGISVPYMSQIEIGDRPLTAPVLAALARAFPGEWADIDPDEETALLVGAMEAATDPSIAAARLDAEATRRAVRYQPRMAGRMVALHEAYRRSQEQLRVLDDQVGTGMHEASRMPWEAVRDWFHTERNYVDSLDRRAEALAEQWNATDPRQALERSLLDHWGIRIKGLPDGDLALRRFDPVGRTLSLDRSQPPETLTFALAHQYVRLDFAPLIEAIVARADVGSETGRELLRAGLANYAAGALLMPYGPFRAAARQYRHDIDRLRQHFGTSFEQTCHRLSTLQRPGALGVPFFFCRVDMAGNITKRHSATRLQFARFGGACPLWMVYEAVAIPDRILVQLAETPDGVRYVSMAKGLVKPSGSYLRPPRRYAVALGCEESHAPEFIYAEGLRTGGMATPIGISCRICPRPDCDQRAFPPAGSDISIDPDVRAAVPYVVR